LKSKGLEYIEGVELVGASVGCDGTMRVPEQQLKSVGYVCEVVHRQGSEIFGDPYATGFFVAVDCVRPEHKGKCMYYFVTARHVATDLEDREVYFSVNKKGGGTTKGEVKSPHPTWLTHPTDSNADVAVVQVALDPTIIDVSPIPIEHFGMPERLSKLNIGIGDEVHSIGLFSPNPGAESNTPIIRFGNLSMVSSEKVQTELGFTEMYLVEARSIGGMSGSPVFVRPTFAQRVGRADGGSALCFSPGSGETLLGMAQGHWDIREEEINKPSFTHDSKRGVNYGVALVVPAWKIYETLYQPELVSMRRFQEEGIIRKRKMTPRSDSPKAKNDKPFTQSDFETALTKVTRRKSDKT
jgi:hypothetical protein